MDPIGKSAGMVFDAQPHEDCEDLDGQQRAFSAILDKANRPTSVEANMVRFVGHASYAESWAAQGAVGGAVLGWCIGPPGGVIS